MKEPFRLLDLPQLVLHQVFRNGFNVVYLALCNSKSHQAVVDAKLKEYRMTLVLSSEKKYICLIVPNWDFIWFVFQKKKIIEEQQEGIENVKVGDHSFWIRKSEIAPGNQQYVYTENIDIAIGIMKDLVKCLVKARISYDLSLDGLQNFQKFFLQNVATDDCKSVTVEWGNQHPDYRRYSEYRYPPIPHDIMSLVLEKTPSNSCLTIKHKTENDFKHEKSLNIQHLHILKAGWFNAQNLFNARVKVLHIWEANQLTIADLKEFITRWTDGEYPEFRLVHISFYYRDWPLYWHNNPETKRILYEGLDVTLWQCDQKMKLNDYCTIRPGMGMDMADFKRADGVKATIGIGEHEFVFTCDIQASRAENAPSYCLSWLLCI